MTAPMFIADSSSLDRLLTDFAPGDRLTLPVGLARHVVKSLRMNVGEELMVSDGQGTRVEAVLDEAEKGLVRVQAVSQEAPASVRLCLVQALAKAGRDEMAIEESTEIGVDEVIPWQADRSIVQWEGAKAAKAARKWESVLRAASEQSRRAWLPVLRERLTTNQLVRLIEGKIAAGNLVVVLHQDSAEGWSAVENRCRQLVEAARQTETVPTVYVVVGPEGGISEREIERFLAAGAVTSLIGRNILRASTAGPVALSLLSRVVGRFES